jgi:hypothetical protein
VNDVVTVSMKPRRYRRLVLGSFRPCGWSCSVNLLCKVVVRRTDVCLVGGGERQRAEGYQAAEPRWSLCGIDRLSVGDEVLLL